MLFNALLLAQMMFEMDVAELNPFGGIEPAQEGMFYF
jgi:hypothetical protein